MSLFYSNPHCGYGGQCFLFDSVQVRSHSDLSKLFILWRIFPPAIFAAFMPSLFGRFCHLILYIFRLFSLDFSPIIFSYSCNLLGEIILGSCQHYKVCTTWPMAMQYRFVCMFSSQQIAQFVKSAPSPETFL